MVEVIEFGPELRRLRAKRHMGLRELAREVHYSPGYVSKMEKSLVPPTREFVEACDRVLEPHPPLIETTMVTARQAAQFQLTRPAQLPAAVTDFIGRSDVLGTLDAALTTPAEAGSAPIAVIEGAPGMGKTSLALRWAHANANRYPDGALFANLRGFAPRGVRLHPGDVLEDWLRTLGVPAERIPTEVESRSALFRSLLANKRLLIVLDNVATAHQVMPLLPSSAHCAVLVTSRMNLTQLLSSTGAGRIMLTEFPPEHALDLLCNVIGADRVAAEREAAETIAARCGHLPLALGIVARYIDAHPHDSLADLTAQLEAQSAQRVGFDLDMFAAADDTVTIRAAFCWSYQALSSEAQGMFTLLGVHAGTELSVEAAAALAAQPIDTTRALVDQLTAGHLLENIGPGRYRLHDLLRAYAADKAEKRLDPAERDAAVRRVLSWYLHSACSANNALAPQRGQPELPPPPRGVIPLEFSAEDHAAALAWCEREADNLLAATEQAHDHRQFATAWLIPVVQFHFFQLRKLWRHWIRGSSIGLIAAREAGDRLGEAWCLHNTGHPFQQLRRPDEALRYFEGAVAIREEIGDHWGLGWSTFALGATYSELARPHEAQARLEQSIALFRGIDFDYGVATGQIWLGTVHSQLGELEAAAATLSAGIALYGSLGAREGQGHGLTRLAVVERDRGKPDAALQTLEQANRIKLDLDDHWGLAEVLLIRGQVLRTMGDDQAARRAFTGSLKVFEALLDPRASDARAELATLDLGELPEQVTRVRFNQARTVRSEAGQESRPCPPR